MVFLIYYVVKDILCDIVLKQKYAYKYEICGSSLLLFFLSIFFHIYTRKQVGVIIKLKLI